MSRLKPDFELLSSTDPGPLMSFDSEEESFVVLGKSLISDVEHNLTESVPQISSPNIEEAKRVIEKEIKNLDKSIVGRLAESLSLQEDNPFQNLTNSNNSETDSVGKKIHSTYSPVQNISQESCATTVPLICEEKVEMVSTAESFMHVSNHSEISGGFQEIKSMPKEQNGLKNLGSGKSDVSKINYCFYFFRVTFYLAIFLVKFFDSYIKELLNKTILHSFLVFN